MKHETGTCEPCFTKMWVCIFTCIYPQTSNFCAGHLLISTGQCRNVVESVESFLGFFFIMNTVHFRHITEISALAQNDYKSTFINDSLKNLNIGSYKNFHKSWKSLQAFSMRMFHSVNKLNSQSRCTNQLLRHWVDSLLAVCSHELNKINKSFNSSRVFKC